MEDKKRYKATNVDVSGPFDGWIIEELDDDEYEKEAAKEAEAKKNAAANTKLTSEQLEKKREEQLNKIRELINKKKKEKEEASQNQGQSQTQVSVETTQAETQTQVQAEPPKTASSFTNTANMSDEELEKHLVQKSKDTGIPIEVLRMIEDKKKEIRAKKNQGNGGNSDPKKSDSPTGVEIADTVEARRKQEEAEEYYEDRQVRKLPPKKNVPNGEEIGDRKGLETQADNHDLYNVMDDVGLEEDGLDNDGLDN